MEGGGRSVDKEGGGRVGTAQVPDPLLRICSAPNMRCLNIALVVHSTGRAREAKAREAQGRRREVPRGLLYP
ncbi:hypothetical protein ColTof4_00808 [Colletotrichum tofieldiae]|nr:hypothetical protein ColTof3_08022 [Colletotrichum tofieldiae]GKT68385.1 hypothetical protein ColTof4_00808 [Colletotrichum tofieldiae]GKT90596.1 hypothetical protein Ct61P_08446 [Colletotrichum tofieldiae]